MTKLFRALPLLALTVGLTVAGLALFTDDASAAQPKTRIIAHDSAEQFNNSLYVQSGADAGTLTVDGQKALLMTTLPDAGVAQLTTQFNQLALSGGTVTWAFPTAFSGVPMCWCTDATATAAACNANAPSTTQVTAKGTTTDSVNIICIGPK